MFKSFLVWGAAIIFSVLLISPAQSDQVSYEYDSLGRLTQVLSVSSEAIQEMNFQYDEVGNRLGREAAELPDADGDLIPDYYEDLYPFLDASNPLDALQDHDNDELNNYEEFLYGTDPSDPDTDGDNSVDGIEVTFGSDPLNPGSYPPANFKVPVFNAAGTVFILLALTILGILSITRRQFMKDFRKTRKRSLICLQPAIFCVLVLFLMSLPYRGLANEAPVKKSRPSCNAKSCTPSKKGVVCGHWSTLIEDGFENGFPGSGWDSNYGWTSTDCTSSEGETSIWCDASLEPCRTYNFDRTTSIESYVSHDYVVLPENCDILKLSFDYNYRDFDPFPPFFVPPDFRETLMAYLHWGEVEW